MFGEGVREKVRKKERNTKLIVTKVLLLQGSLFCSNKESCGLIS